MIFSLSIIFAEQMEQLREIIITAFRTIDLQ